jgi:hypothetical protein
MGGYCDEAAVTVRPSVALVVLWHRCAINVWSLPCCSWQLSVKLRRLAS